ncbi:MAG: hypothetical protein ACOYKN_16910, partial [Pirellula sp.]
MPETTVNIFISAVSDEFASYRKALVEFVDRKGVRIEEQDGFIQNGFPILTLLNDYISTCDAVIHLAGDRTGKPDKHGIPDKANFDSLRSVLPNVLDRLGLSEQDLASISYTQWEALLAIYHGKPLFVATPDTSARRDTILADASIADLQKKMQQKHLERLKSVGKRSDFQFESAHHLVAHVYRVLYDILPHSDSKVSPSIPASLGSLFKGRENWFARIREEVKKARGADSVRVVLHGIGGIGKTQLVSEYALACAHEHSVVHLIRGDSKDSFDAGLAELCGVLELPQSDSVNPKEQIKAALRWLDQEENKGWMLLLDNIDDDAMVKEIVQEAKKLHRGVILITSRWGSWPHGFVDLELDLLPEEPAIDYLLEATDSKRIRLDGELGEGTDRRFAKEIVKSLGQLALGLAQAAATINNCRWSFREYQIQWSIARDSLLEDPDFDPVIVGYPRAVGMTWLTTYQRLSAESKLVFDILCWLMPDPIPERLITKAWPVDALEKLEASVRQAVESKLRKLMIPLYDYSLASNPIGSQCLFKFHKLIQEVGRIWQCKTSANPVAKDLARLLLDREFVREDNLDNIRLNILPELRPMALHARGMYESQAALDSAYYASRAYRMLAELLNVEGRLVESEQDAIRSVDLSREASSSHLSGELNLAESLSILCQTQDQRGYFDRALKAGHEQQAILEELCTKEPENLAHRSDLGIAMENVGRVLENKGDNDGALALFSKSQAIRDELCTKEPENLAHRRDLGIALNYVGGVLEKKGDNDGALALFSKSQAISEELCTKEPENLAHRRDLGIALNYVGRVLENKGDNDGALTLFSKSQAISEELCTKEPENLAHSRKRGIALNNVGRVLETRGDNDGALTLFSKLRTILEELCTKEPENLAHRRDLGIALNYVGGVLEKKGDNDGALALFSKSQAISEELCTKEPENLAHRR